jgi:ubiquinone/menaquinone biosynthesis C-methylase UbiE
MNFYSRISEFYDSMIGFDRFLDSQIKTYGVFLKKYPVKTAVDTACGSGFHSIALAKSGVKVIGSDIDGAMLKSASKNAERYGVDIKWVRAPFHRMHNKIGATVDAVFCMGNSIPHLLTPKSLIMSLKSFADTLKPNGVLVIQLLNYTGILQSGERIINIRRDKNDEYIRFYDFLSAKRVRFNILKVDWNGESPKHIIYSTVLRPYSAKDLADTLKQAGFADIETFADIDFSVYDKDKSILTTLIAHKG